MSLRGEQPLRQIKPPAGAWLVQKNREVTPAADLYPWRGHDAPVPFPFGNEIDTHLQTRATRAGSLFGFLCIRFTGSVAKDRHPVAVHATSRCPRARRGLVLSTPEWEDVSDFDIDAHLHRQRRGVDVDRTTPGAMVPVDLRPLKHTGSSATRSVW